MDKKRLESISEGFLFHFKGLTMLKRAATKRDSSKLLFRNNFLSLSCTVDKEQKKSYQPLGQTVYISVSGQRPMLLMCDNGRAEKEADISGYSTVPDVKTLSRYANYPLPRQFTLEWLVTTTTSNRL